MFFNFLICVCWVTALLLLWFKSNAVISYYSLIRKLFTITVLENYIKASSDGLDLSLPEYLHESYNSFLTKLLVCPLCSAVWLSLITTTLYASVVLWPACLIFGLILYAVTSKILSYA